MAQSWPLCLYLGTGPHASPFLFFVFFSGCSLPTVEGEGHKKTCLKGNALDTELWQGAPCGSVSLLHTTGPMSGLWVAWAHLNQLLFWSLAVGTFVYRCDMEVGQGNVWNKGGAAS